MSKIIEVKIPGKLFFTGEWSVLKKNNSSIILPINKFIKVRIKSSNRIILNAKDINLKNIIFNFIKNKLEIENKLNTSKKKNLSFAKKAIETALKYLTERKIFIKNFSLNINSQFPKIKLQNGKTTKIGLGSSAATTVAIISALLKFHKIKIHSKQKKNLIFKLSSISHYFTQNKSGSCADIAVCTYQKPIIYKRFDSSWLERKLEKTNSLTKIIKIKWPNLKISYIQIPSNLILCVGFTGISASTKKILEQIFIFKKNDNNKFCDITNSLNKITLKLIKSFKEKISQKQSQTILNLIKENRTLLKKLPNLETKKLTQLIEIAEKYNSSAKFSGSGAGDCGIAVCFNKQISTKIKNDWLAKKIYPLNIKILNSTLSL